MPGELVPAEDTGGARNRFSCTLDLGWRMAELYALARTQVDPDHTALLPSHESLPQPEQLRLQADAVAGDAEGIGLRVQVRPLLQLAGEIGSEEGTGRFRDEVCKLHLSLQRHLWRAREAEGKAYELGNALSDTVNLIAREESVRDKLAALRYAFRVGRVRWLDRLLGDLQSRLGERGVAVVSKHLHEWNSFVEKELPALEGELVKDPAKWELAERELRSQTLIWRQFLTLDQEPEAYLSERRRNEVRHRMARRALVSYLRPLPIVLAAVLVLGGAALFGPLSNFYETNKQLFTVVGAVGAFMLSVLGLSRAAVAATLRSRISTWADLLYNRALTDAVCEATLKTSEIRASLSRTTRLRAAAAGKDIPGALIGAGGGMSAARREPAENEAPRTADGGNPGGARMGRE